MKYSHSFPIVFICLFCCFHISAQYVNQGLIDRLNHYSGKSYKSAVNDLKKKYPDTYNPGNNWSKALEDLENNKKSLIRELKNGNSKAVKQAVNNWMQRFLPIRC